MEYEKKYLLEDPPDDLYRSPRVPIEQAYVMVTGSEELRVRKKGEGFFLTLKKGRGSARQEVEITIPEEQYRLFAEQAVGEVICKNRLEYPVEGLTAEIDVYKGRLEGLAVVEVEFPSPECMDAFTAPAWFGEDVTDLDEFKNRKLALDGFPDLLVRRWRHGRRPAWHYRQSGVVPFRRTTSGLEVLLITSRSAGRWIVPKGIVEPDLSPPESAVLEALDEAGAEGTVVEGLSESYPHEKWNGTCTVTLFPLAVEELHSPWAEAGVRERRWVDRADIDDCVKDSGLAAAVKRLLNDLPT